ncbi:MAG: metalloregulator ArsR/SmtB family transcription factor [Candidatus Bathyarchaeia archaeon]
MVLREPVYMKRVERLTTLGLCSTIDASRHLAELKGIVRDRVDEREVKIQSRIFRALSDPTRLKILRLLSVREMCVCELMAALDAMQPTISYHLNILENTNLVKRKRKGRWMFYSLTSPTILKLLNKIQRSL